MRRIRWVLLPVLLVAGSMLAACEGGNGNSGGNADGDSAGNQPLAADGPEPAEMCDDGKAPAVAAYEADTGKYRWVACAEEQGYASVRAATDDRVFVGLLGPERRYLGFDAASGKEVWRGTEAEYREQLPADADVITQEPPEVDGVRLTGGQDDPLVAVDAATGAERWSQPTALLVYDDVWAVGDGAVFAVDREGSTSGPAGPQTKVVAYEIASGGVRWQRHTGGYLWPWYVRGDRLFVLWDNLEVLDTADGKVVWQTEYAATESGFPRMTGAVANDDFVFVSFTVVRSGGD